MAKEQGIYQIRNLSNGKVYIGSSVNIRNRWNNHRSNLKNNTHCNIYLQRAWNKYGKRNFIFEILDNVSPAEDVFEVEQWYLDNIVKWGFDYNISENASASMLGRTMSDETRRKMSKSHSKEKHPLWGKKHSEESKKKMSDSAKGLREGKKHPLWGKHHSKETKNKMSESARNRKTISEETRQRLSDATSGENHPLARLSESDVLEIRRLNETGDYLLKELADIFNVTTSHIGNIVKRRVWKKI